MTQDFSKDPFTIDVTQRDILAYPLAIRPYHVIYGQPPNSFPIEFNLCSGPGRVVSSGLITSVIVCLHPKPITWFKDYPGTADQYSGVKRSTHAFNVLYSYSFSLLDDLMSLTQLFIINIILLSCLFTLQFLSRF